MAPSRKATKKAALQKLRTARHEGFARFNSDHVNSDDDAFDDDDGARARSHLDSVKFDEEKPVYEEMDEEAYRNYVSEKLDREDFVVDDGLLLAFYGAHRFQTTSTADGLGYHDDGEYDIRNLGSNDDHHNNNHPNKKKRGNGTAALTKEALRKARKTKALIGGEFYLC
eukprot:scaffold888_cov208-Alexandrium_tamarense.AAC.9